MKDIVKTLLELQQLQQLTLNSRRKSSTSAEELKRLRARVPESILARFDRLASRGKSSVAPAQNGVCGGCHLQVSRGTMATLTHRGVLPVCEHCGRYLYLSGNEPVLSPPLPAKSNSPRRKKEANIHVN